MCNRFCKFRLKLFLIFIVFIQKKKPGCARGMGREAGKSGHFPHGGRAVPIHRISEYSIGTMKNCIHRC